MIKIEVTLFELECFFFFVLMTTISSWKGCIITVGIGSIVFRWFFARSFPHWFAFIWFQTIRIGMTTFATISTFVSTKNWTSDNTLKKLN